MTYVLVQHLNLLLKAYSYFDAIFYFIICLFYSAEPTTSAKDLVLCGDCFATLEGV